MHGLLTLFTCGLWSIVWLILAIGENKDDLVTNMYVDEYGRFWVNGQLGQPSQPPQVDPIPVVRQQMERLKALRRAGALSEEEFQRMKAKLLEAPEQ